MIHSYTYLFVFVALEDVRSPKYTILAVVLHIFILFLDANQTANCLHTAVVCSGPKQST